MKPIRILVVACALHQFQPLAAFAQPCDFDWDVSIGHPGMDSEVTALAVHDDGTGPALFAGGLFFNAGGNPAMRIAKWDGESWLPLGPGLGGDSNDFSSAVHALVSYDDGNGQALFAGGLFNRSGAENGLNGVAVWRDGQWSALGTGIHTKGGFAGEVFTLAVFDDGLGPALYVGGNFITAGNVSSRAIAKWDGQDWSALGTGLLGNVYDMAVYDDGSGPALYVTGDYGSIVGESVISKWNGQNWVRMPGGKPRGAWENYSPCPIGHFCPVYNRPSGHSLEVFDDGRGESLYIAGFFTGIGTTKVSGIASWSGLRWSRLVGGSPETGITGLITFDDGTGPALYVGSSRWDGREWSVLGDGVTGDAIDAMVGFDDGSGNALYIGGRIDAAGGQPTQNIARWKCPE